MDNAIEFQKLKDRITILEHYVSNLIKNNETVDLPVKAIKKISKSDEKKKEEERYFKLRTVF
jgi:hypothetical protein